MAENKITADVDRITIDTGRSKYTFSGSWVKNEALNSILAGLIADDLQSGGGKTES